MKDSKEKEHRISNLKNMIDNVNKEDVPDEIEEDIELINYLNEDSDDEEEDLEIDDEFIYRPDEDKGHAINLEENPIDEEYIIKTPKEKELEDKDDEDYESEEEEYEFGEMSESFDHLIHAKVGRTPIIAIISAFLGLLLIAISAFIFSSRSDRIIDNVVSGETNFISVIFLIFGVLLFIYGVYKILGFKNPLENLSRSIDSVETNNNDGAPKKDETEEKNSKWSHGLFDVIMV